MRVDDDLLDGGPLLRDLIEGLGVLAEQPPTPNPALRLFLAEQEAATRPVPRSVPSCSEVLPGAGARDRRHGRSRRTIAARLASLGLVAKVALGSGVALAGFTGAGVAGALPPALQDVWDGGGEAAAPRQAPADDGPAVPGAPRDEPTSGAGAGAGAGAGTAPDAAPPADVAADGAAQSRPAGTADSAGGSSELQPGAGTGTGTDPATGTGTGQPAGAADDPPQPARQSSDEVPGAPSAPTSPPATGGEQPGIDSGADAGDAWMPPPSAPSSGSTSPSTAPAPTQDEPAWAPPQDPPASAPAAPTDRTPGGADVGTDAGSGTGAGAGTGTGSGTGTGAGTGSGSGTGGGGW